MLLVKQWILWQNKSLDTQKKILLFTSEVCIPELINIQKQEEKKE